MTDVKAPAPEQETPEPLPATLLRELEGALQRAHQASLEGDEGIRLEGREGPRAGWLLARVGEEGRPWEFELFVRDVAGEGLDGPLGVLLDFLDGVLTEFFEADRDAWLPLDFVGHPYELGGGLTCVVFARGTRRDLDAEAAADRLLAEHGGIDEV